MTEYHPFAAAVAEHIFEVYGAEPEFPWENTPEHAVFRHSTTKKWFALMLRALPKHKLGLDEDGCVDVLNLKRDPLLTAVDHVGIFPAYHMNKEHWLSVRLDGTVPMEQVEWLIARSYALIAAKRR